MRDDQLRAAMNEAERFLALAKMLRKRKDKLAGTGKANARYEGCAETGFVRRSSMDLTRALAALRDPWGRRNEQ